MIFGFKVLSVKHGVYSLTSDDGEGGTVITEVVAAEIELQAEAPQGLGIPFAQSFKLVVSDPDQIAAFTANTGKVMNLSLA